MPVSDAEKEAGRVMTICNACRYCEGFCAVYPAMELRRTFTDKDLKYFAHLCHNCRGCYYACQYAPPHEFALNVPQTLARLRLETYREFSTPRFLAGLFRQNGSKASLISVLCTAVALLLLFALQDATVILTPHVGENAFYKVIPYAVMVVLFTVLGLGILTALVSGALRFWRATGGSVGALFDPRANLRAIRDALRLRYLDGGGHGCNYPDDRFSMIRRWYHHFTFYGFMLCFASTSVAAFYDHFLHRSAPYPFFSWPVLLGTAGGAALLIGTGGLLYLKSKMDRVPTAERSFGMDIVFLVLLFMTSFSGLLLLVMRETAAMGILLALHLGIVAGLFITMPYGKFIHAVYRYAALVRNAIEQAREPGK